MILPNIVTATRMLLLITLLLTGCGRKGPLYMQPPSAKPESISRVEAEPKQTTTTQPQVEPALPGLPALTPSDIQK